MKVKLKNEKKSGRGIGGSTVDGLAPQMRDGNQSPWKQQKSTDHIIPLTNTHLQCMDTHKHTYTRIYRGSVLQQCFCLRSVLLNEHDGFLQRLRGSIKHTQSF